MAMTAGDIEWIKIKAREKAWDAYVDASNVCDFAEEAMRKRLAQLAEAEKARNYAWEAYKALDNADKALDNAE